MKANRSVAWRMINAEFLKLRKKRSLLAWSLLLAAGSVAIYFAWTALQPASTPVPSPAGGIDGFRHAIEIIGVFIGPLAAVLIGAEAGTGDCAAGTFRDLVVTGRSRLALFAARIPGALMLCLTLIAIAYGLAVACTFLLAGRSPTPSASTVLAGLGWSCLVDGVVCVVAIGLASLTCSRPATITALIGFELVASPVLLQTTSLGWGRKLLLDSSVLRLSPITLRGAPVVPVSLAVALLVIGAWLVAATALGAWRTATMDT